MHNKSAQKLSVVQRIQFLGTKGSVWGWNDPRTLLGAKKILPPKSPSITLGGYASLYRGEGFFQLGGNSLHVCKEACHIFGSTNVVLISRNSVIILTVGIFCFWYHCLLARSLFTLALTPNSRNDRPLIKISSQIRGCSWHRVILLCVHLVLDQKDQRQRHPPLSRQGEPARSGATRCLGAEEHKQLPRHYWFSVGLR